MSSTWAIAAVTGVLEYMLGDAYSEAGLGGQVQLSAKAPDVVQAGLAAHSVALQTNLFLHQVTPNAAWRNVGQPTVAADGSTRLKNPPLALDLHYLLTVYASDDFMAEAILGPAVLMLFEYPMLSRNEIRTALSKVTSTSAAHLIASGLADQIEMIKITPATLGREEIAWIWTALKADYRPTFPFQASVVLIQPQNPAVGPLPVLTRNLTVQPNLLSPSPTLSVVTLPGGQPAASPGDTATVTGANLSGTTGVTLINAQLGIEQTLPLSGAARNSSIQFVIPNTGSPADPPAGVYLLSAQAAGEISSNGLPLAIAPKILSALPATVGHSGTLGLTCAPYLRVGQQVSLLIGGQEALVTSFTPPTNTPSFDLSTLEPTAASLPVRLRVDGIDSPIIDMTKTPPAYSGTLVQVT